MSFQDTSLTSAAGATNSLWRTRGFLLLWGGQTVSELGTRMAGVAVPLLAVTTLHASVFQVSLLTVLAWLLYLVFSLPAGVLADRVDHRRLMIFCDLARMLFTLSLPVAAAVGRLTLGYLYFAVPRPGASRSSSKSPTGVSCLRLSVLINWLRAMPSS